MLDSLNMSRVIVGTDTDSVEDASQVLLVDVPTELDSDDVPQWVVDHPEHTQQVVGWNDLEASLRLILDAEGADTDKIIASLFDAFDNND